MISSGEPNQAEYSPSLVIRIEWLQISDRLYDHQSVEWITVVMRKMNQHSSMAWQDRQERKPIAFNCGRKEFFEQSGKRISSKTNLDGQFSVAGRAHPLLIGRIFNQLASFGTATLIAEGKPQQSVSIEEKFQYMYSAKSFKCSSSSEMIVSIPLQLPNFGVPRLGGTIRATVF